MPELDHPALVTPGPEGDPTDSPPRGPSRANHLRSSVPVLLAFLSLVACEPENFGREIVVENRTGSALTVVEVDSDGQDIGRHVTVQPSESAAILLWTDLDEPSLVGQGECTIVDVVALDPDGREVARHPPPLCLDDVWVIESE